MFKSTDYDKAPLQSKKFLAYMFSNIAMKIFLFYTVRQKAGDLVIMTAIGCSAFLDIGFILGQASLDKAVRVAGIMADKLSFSKKESSSSEQQP